MNTITIYFKNLIGLQPIHYRKIGIEIFALFDNWTLEVQKEE